MVVINDNEKEDFKKILEEKEKDLIQKREIKIDIENNINEVKKLLETNVTQSEKIEELLQDGLNKWVREGIDLHKNKINTCAFCGNSISEQRWEKLEKYFSEEYKKLENKILELINNLENEKIRIPDILYNVTDFYSKYHIEVKDMLSEYQILVKEYKKYIDNLIKQLTYKKDNMLMAYNVIDYNFSINDFQNLILKINALVKESNEYSKNLNEEQKKAKEKLRLKEVYDYLNIINYDSIIKEIEDLKNSDVYKNPKYKEIEAEINNKRKEIEEKKKELNDEEKGAEKVNEYLQHFFRNNLLKLSPVKLSDTNNNIQTKFEIQRDGVKAFHLSEGENRLIAFCYFMAKLHDVAGEKIIWIDDPISSLDSNHIFSVYSLIDSEIVHKKLYKQLFISTHNLSFFKYLKRLDCNKDYNNKNLGYFIVERNSLSSSLNKMPDYMSKYVTEFNYLFKQIYECSKIEIVNDVNYSYLINFGNNARKFLELLLYYKYPNLKNVDEKYKLFFKNDIDNISLINRIVNEGSHLSGVLERGETMRESDSEIIKAANIILEQMIENDEEQYNALVESIKENIQTN